jgi:hypothetical protein
MTHLLIPKIILGFSRAVPPTKSRMSVDSLSGWGQPPKFSGAQLMSALTPRADMEPKFSDVR